MTISKRKEKGEKRNTEFYTLRRIIPRRRRGIKLRGARIEDEDAWIPIRAAREKSSRGSCPRGNISRTSKEEGPKRKRFARIRGRKEPKRKRNVCVYERERVFAREDWKTYAKEKERDHRRRMKRVCERAASGPCAREVVALHKRFPTLCGGFGYGSV